MILCVYFCSDTHSLFQGLTLEPSLMRCCHIPCGGRPVDYAVKISNKLLLDIRRHIKKYYSVSIAVFVRQFATLSEVLIITMDSFNKTLLNTHSKTQAHTFTTFMYLLFHHLQGRKWTWFSFHDELLLFFLLFFF